MTRKEAIDIIKCLAWHTRPDEEDVEQAIKALEQEPCEDAISRTAAIVQLSHNKNGDDDCDVIIQKDIETIKALPSVTPKILEPCEDCISREAAIDALWKALYEYEDKTEKQFLESEELDVANWFQHRIFVQNMSDIDRQTILNLPSVTPKFTDSEIQKMQELEQAQLEKAYELGKAEMQPCEDCISRTALLARIDEERKHLLDLNMDGAEHIIVHHARRIIEDMPAITPNWDKKIKNAESTDWVRKGLSDEEVEKIILNAQKNARERIEADKK